MNDFPAWLIAIVTALFGGVVVAGRWMWNRIVTGFDQCEKDRQALRDDAKATYEEVQKIKETLAVFEGCQSSPCGAMESLQRRHEFRETYHLNFELKKVRKP